MAANYDVLFQNAAVEDLLGFGDIKKNLHLPVMVFQNHKLTVSQITLKSDDELQATDVQVLHRDDHYHYDFNESQCVGLQNSSLTGANRQKWVNFRRQEILFGGQKCLLLSVRDVTP